LLRRQLRNRQYGLQQIAHVGGRQRRQHLEFKLFERRVARVGFITTMCWTRSKTPT
jgi:hypothetical protein